MAAATITFLRRKKLEDNRQMVHTKIVLGDGSTTYPSGGIPISGNSLGLPRYLDSFEFSDASDGDTNIYKYDIVNQAIRIYVQNNSTQAYAEMTGVIPAITLYTMAIGAR